MAAAAAAAQAAADARIATDAAAAQALADAAAAAGQRPRTARNPNAAVLGEFDYTNKAHLSMYERNTESIYGNEKGTAKFDLEPEKLQSFMALFETRAKRCNWAGLLTYISAGGTPTYLVDHYGSVTEAQVRAKALIYLPLQGRMTQDSEQIYQCLLASVSPEAFNRLKNLHERFNVIITIEGIREELTDGPLLLITIIGLSYTNLRAMGTIYREQMSNKLDTKMREIEGANIETFNAHVKKLRNLLAAGGGTCDDLQHYLIKAYKQTGDQEFTTYIRQKELAWKDGIIEWDALGTDVMSLAENYYRDARANDNWMQASGEQTRIIALEAQLRSASMSVKALQSVVASGNYQQKKTRDDKKREPRPIRPEDAWKTIAPTEKEGSSKKMNKKTYHWCAAHKMWCIHTAAECRLVQAATPVMSTVFDDSSSSDDSNDSDSFGNCDVNSVESNTP